MVHSIAFKGNPVTGPIITEVFLSSNENSCQVHILRGH